MQQITEDIVFEGENYTEIPLTPGRYESCTFRNCLFTNSSLSQIQFVDCIFSSCDLSNVKVFDTAFKKVRFSGSKLTGIQFNRVHEFMFSVEFDQCNLQLCSFTGMNLKKTNFSKCLLREADFRQTDLTESVFDECNLLQALFDNTNLHKADLRTSFNFSIDPAQNRIQKAKFSKEGALGLLDQLDIIID